MARSRRTDHTTTYASSKADPEPARLPADEQTCLSPAEIETRIQAAATAGECRHWQVISLLADGAPLGAIEAATSCRPRTIRQIAQRYREQGPAGLADGRQRSPGAAPILAADQREALRQALQSPAPDGGSWTGPKVAQWIAERTGRHVHRQRGWEYLRRLAGTPAAADRSFVKPNKRK